MVYLLKAFLIYQNLSSFFINQAITSLQGSNEPNYEGAYKAFKLSLRVNPEDTLGLLYGGFVAEQLNKYEEAFNYSKIKPKLNY